MHQIGANSVPPMNSMMKRAFGVVLVEQVIETVPLYKPVRIVEPIGRRHVVVLRAMGIVSKVLADLLVGLFQYVDVHGTRFLSKLAINVQPSAFSEEQSILSQDAE